MTTNSSILSMARTVFNKINFQRKNGDLDPDGLASFIKSKHRYNVFHKDDVSDDPEKSDDEKSDDEKRKGDKNSRKRERDYSISDDEEWLIEKIKKISSGDGPSELPELKFFNNDDSADDKKNSKGKGNRNVSRTGERIDNDIEDSGEKINTIVKNLSQEDEEKLTKDVIKNIENEARESKIDNLPLFAGLGKRRATPQNTAEIIARNIEKVFRKLFNALNEDYISDRRDRSGSSEDYISDRRDRSGSRDRRNRRGSSEAEDDDDKRGSEGTGDDNNFAKEYLNNTIIRNVATFALDQLTESKDPSIISRKFAQLVKIENLHKQYMQTLAKMLDKKGNKIINSMQINTQKKTINTTSEDFRYLKQNMLLEFIFYVIKRWDDYLYKNKLAQNHTAAQNYAEFEDTVKNIGSESLRNFLNEFGDQLKTWRRDEQRLERAASAPERKGWEERRFILIS